MSQELLLVGFGFKNDIGVFRHIIAGVPCLLLSIFVTDEYDLYFFILKRAVFFAVYVLKFKLSIERIAVETHHMNLIEAEITLLVGQGVDIAAYLYACR